jgi:hypothetical protein
MNIGWKMSHMDSQLVTVTPRLCEHLFLERFQSKLSDPDNVKYNSDRVLIDIWQDIIPIDL